MKEILTALLDIQKEIEAVAKTSTNPFHKSKYADLSAVQREVLPRLNKYGILVVNKPIISDKEGHVALRMTLCHIKSGQVLDFTGDTKPINMTPQSVGGAYTYLRRYILSAAVCLDQVDDDGNQASGRKTTTKQIAKNNIDYKALLDNSKNLQELNEIYKKVPENMIIGLASYYNRLSKGLAEVEQAEAEALY